ncbi:MAG: DUF4268 domain-containing protein [Myxococcales bacterium]
MQAAEAKLQKVLDGNKQFLVPHYQRPYSWTDEQWKVLWRDILQLLEEENPQPHFLGSIVTAPARSVPEGVEKRLLVDGQQRLTTLLILLTLIRDRARESGLTKLADQTEGLYLTNRYESGNEFYKLLPTQGEDLPTSDRHNFVRLVKGDPVDSSTAIGAAYTWFHRQLQRGNAPDIEVLQRTVVGKLTLVSIILDENDNPHRIFESLNGKGRPLSQADLIRNYFFMRIHEKEHEHTYANLWNPMQRRLGDKALTPFVRHLLSKDGAIVRESDVYSTLKRQVDEDRSKTAIEHLKELDRASYFYKILLVPDEAKSDPIATRLHRLNRLEVTVAYPFLLGVLDDRAQGKLTDDDVCAVLDVIESFLVRRFVCGVPTHGLNKVFVALYGQATALGAFVEAVKTLLSAKGCPRDEEFRERLETARLYGAGERPNRTKLILERIEASYGHKELVVSDQLSIEHVMPQSLTDEWRAALGPTWEEDHEALLHTLGNLTLTNYNSELTNASFAKKKKFYASSHLELNGHFAGVAHWTSTEIEQRAVSLAGRAIHVWPWFGPAVAVAPEHGEDNRRLEFWGDVREALANTGEFPSLQAPRDQHWFYIKIGRFKIGRSHVWLQLSASVRNKDVGVKLVLESPAADGLLDVLASQRGLIEEEIGSALAWNAHPQKKQKTVKLSRPCSFLDPVQRDEAIAWLTQTAVAFKKSFVPRLDATSPATS